MIHNFLRLVFFLQVPYLLLVWLLHLLKHLDFLLGKNYLIPVISWQQSTLLTLSLQTLANLDDGSMFLSMNAEYSLSDNLYMGLGYHHFIGEDFNFFNEIPNDALFEFGSEYGSNPDSIFVSLRYYF